jgi:hypothetical protein
VRHAVVGTAAATRDLISAHVELLRAELGSAARQVAIIAGLAAVALVLALLMLILLYVGTCLFVGEWLFGSIGWGLLDGLLLTAAAGIVPIALEVGGGKVGAWLRALLASLLVTVVLGVLFAWNAARNSALWLGQQLQPSFSLDIGFLTWFAAAVVVGVVLGVVLLVAGWRRGLGRPLLIAGLVLGFLGGALLGYITFDTRGAAAVAVTLGLIMWLVLTGVLAMRAGIDPKARYEKLVPRESIAQFEATRTYLEQEWQRQQKKPDRK